MKNEIALKVVQIVDLPSVSDYFKQAFKNGIVQYQMKLAMTEDEVIAAAYDADVLIVVPAYRPIPRKIIERLPKCRYILDLISGYDAIDIETATEHGILVTNMPDLFYQEVSDHTMALILACSRQIVALNQLAKRGEWVANPMDSKFGWEIWPKLNRLQGQTLGLIGFGRVAHSLVPKARGFGMRIITFDPYISQSVLEKFGVECVELDQLLRESDFVSILIPLTSETRGMLKLADFQKMKPTAYIINTARGPIIDRKSLYAALTQGIIAGAGLDVTDPEPSTPENNPLLSLENIIITAHNAGVGKMAFADLVRLVPEQVFKVARGEWPHNLVNPEVKERYIKKWSQL
ncbi:C-terminal binding protein [Chloroflexota bacterium]